LADKRVLHVLDILSPDSGVANIVACVSGIESGIKTIAQDVVVYGECNEEMEKKIIGTVYKLPHIKESFGKKFSKQFSRLLEEKDYSIVHGHLLNSAFIYLKEAERQNVNGRIIHAHSASGADTITKRVRNKILTRTALSAATDKIAVSPQAGKNAFGSDCEVFENGVDVERFTFNPDVRKQMRDELGLDESIICAGHVGRFAGLKNHRFLLKVFQVMKSRVECRLVLVGDGELKEQILGIAQERGLAEFITFTGVREDVERFYQAFDVFLLPSRSEGFSLAAVEAQCSGLSCVVSNKVPEIVRCSDNIIFLPPDSEEEWATAAIENAKKPRGTHYAAEAGLDTETMCRKFSGLYEHILAR